MEALGFSDEREDETRKSNLLQDASLTHSFYLFSLSHAHKLTQTNCEKSDVCTDVTSITVSRVLFVLWLIFIYLFIFCWFFVCLFVRSFLFVCFFFLQVPDAAEMSVGLNYTCVYV